MVIDATSLILAAFAAWIAKRPPSKQHTYGLGRAEVLGAWCSSLIMVILVVVLAIEALERLAHPQSVNAKMVILIGFIGTLINLTMMWLLKHGEKTFNMRAALLHVASDLLGSIAAFIAGIIIYFTDWYPIDPILSLFICVLILFSSFQLLKETLGVLMEGVPPHLDIREVGNAMAGIDKVLSIHDLHIWTLSSGMIVLTAHVEIEDLVQWQTILTQLRHLLEEEFDIHHVTLQPESRLQIIPFKH